MTTTTENIIHLGGREFAVVPMPWGRLRKTLAAINRVGMAAAAGVFDERSLDDMAAVLCAGYSLTPAELDDMPTDLVELQAAFEAIVRVSGLEQAMEKALGEARRAGRLALPAALTPPAVVPQPLTDLPPIPGTSSTPT